MVTVAVTSIFVTIALVETVFALTTVLWYLLGSPNEPTGNGSKNE